jgi:hypothetical protein
LLKSNQSQFKCDRTVLKKKPKEMKVIIWMAFGLLAQLTLGNIIIIRDPSVGKEYYARAALCSLIVSVLELGSHFDISRSVSLVDARGALLYRFIALNAVGIVVSTLVVTLKIVQCHILETILTFLTISLRPHSLAIMKKSENKFWRNESAISWLGVSLVTVISDVKVGVLIFLLLKSVSYIFLSRQIFQPEILGSQRLNDVKKYIKSRGIGGAIERGYFNLSWPFLPIVLSNSELNYFDKTWPTLERICAAIVSFLPTCLNNNPTHYWRNVLIIRRVIGIVFLITIISVRSEAVTWILSVLYICLTDALLLSAMVSKAKIKTTIFSLSSIALSIMYLTISLHLCSLGWSMVIYCFINEGLLLALQPFNKLTAEHPEQ